MHMRSCYRGSFARLLGDDALKGSKLTKQEGDFIDFLVTDKKQDNFLSYCNEIVLPINPQETIKKYTEHTTEHYARVNLSLASDSDKLQEYGDYITQLRNSIFSQAFLDDAIVYRGVELSKLEVDKMEELGQFFIPSFTSTSLESNKAYSKNAMMIVKIPYASQYACSITANLSNYFNEEREVLLSCYSAFRLERIEVVNNTKFITLLLDDHLSSMNSIFPHAKTFC